MVNVSVVHQIPNGIQELSADLFSLYPNPASGYVTITTTDDIQTVRIMSQTGAVQRVDSLSGRQYRLSLAGLAAGIYYIEVIGSEQTGCRKLVVVGN
jgi:hypothetical protein